MPSVISHAIAGGALARAFGPPNWKPALIAAISAMVPDADAIGFFAGVPYDSLFGHRGFTHSLMFAALWACAMVLLFFRRSPRWGWVFAVVFIATASHPLLDMLTNGGLGAALFSPFSNERYFFPWRPVRVSPISVTGFFTERGVSVLVSEMRWVWAPSLLLWAAFRWARGRSAR